MPASSIRRSRRLASNGMDDAAGFTEVSMVGVPRGFRDSRPDSASKQALRHADLECQLYLTLACAVGNVAPILREEHAMRARWPASASVAPALLSRVSRAAPQPAAAQTEFYKGKTIELIISTGAGGGLDTNGRIVARHLGNQIPGNPTVVAKNMPGAGHIRAANYVYSQAPKD